jgi:hypothetical protein
MVLVLLVLLVVLPVEPVGAVLRMRPPFPPPLLCLRRGESTDL